MNKKLFASIFLGLAISFVGCEDNMTQKSIDKSKAFIDNKEYDKAMALLEMTLDEDKENKEANSLYKIVSSYKGAREALDSNNSEEAKKVLDSMGDEYLSYSIKDDIENMKKDIENYNNEIGKVDSYIREAQSLFDDGKYVECKKFLTNNLLGSDELSIEPNKHLTEEQNKKALDIVDKCNKAIYEKEDKDLKEKEERSKKFTKEQAIAYVVNIYGQPESNMEYKIGHEGLKKSGGKSYYEVYYSVISRGKYPGADYYGYKVFEDGTVIKFFDSMSE